MSDTDGLTGLHNRRYFDTHLEEELARASRNHSTMAVLMLDVDHFKNYNDNYGHPQGDVCLQQVADALNKSISRKGDFVARYGGEEFVVVLPNIERGGAEVVAQRILDSVHDKKIPHEFSPVANHVTISIGITYYAATSKRDFMDTLIKSADAALYQAKENGRVQFMSLASLNHVAVIEKV